MRTDSDKLPHVVAVLPRGEAIRNFVYTGCLDAVRRHARLTVLSVVPNEALGDMLRERYGPYVPLAPVAEAWPTRFTREILDLAHGRHLWSAAARERWRLRDLEAVSPRQRVKRAVKKLAARPFANQRGLDLLSRFERGVSRRLRRSDRFVQLLRELRPTLVFNASHVHGQLGLQPVQAAQWLGIPTAAFIFSWDNLTSQGRIIPPYDAYLVWNEVLRGQLLALYPSVRPDRVFVTGTPQFDPHFQAAHHWSRERFCTVVGADPARPIVLYSTGMDNHVPGEPQIVTALADRLAEMIDLGPPQLLVRVYPKERSNRFERLRRTRPDILLPHIPWETRFLTPEPADVPLLTNMLRHAAVGINVASTVSLELCMLDTPVINVAYDPDGADMGSLRLSEYYGYEHYRPVVASGAVGLARSEAELVWLIREALTAPERRRAARRGLMRDMFGPTLDGASAARVADALVALAAGGRLPRPAPHDRAGTAAAPPAIATRS
jgi:hypothetical protein